LIAKHHPATVAVSVVKELSLRRKASQVTMLGILGARKVPGFRQYSKDLSL